MRQHHYGFTTTTALSVAEAAEATTAALRQEGFGVLTTIDVQATLRARIGVERPPYLILGACNPALASQALTSEPEVGLLLPCNVAIYSDADGQTVVSAIDAVAMFSVVQRDDLAPLAGEVSARLRRVIAAIPGQAA